MAFSDALEHHPESRPFWDALGQGRFLLKHCGDCGKAHWYPRAVCPHCASTATEGRAASGKGTISSYSISRTTGEPTCIAYVALAEGPTMMTRIVDSELRAIRIGDAVGLAIGTAPDGTPLPFFKLI